ncbi:hypothetical protein [Bradyrhizobium retamae]|uniref:hypothetical protein n=1 Tax=Bradyrhizobium retamae TaxID=1300035 RepID=UPI000A818377|nr:hypothetical protein [Bradyrhizobium retamae]
MTKFDGVTYDEAADGDRLTSQLDRVHQHMLDGNYHSLEAIVVKCGGTVASVSARLRDLRKDKFGKHTVERRRVAGGLHEYRLA